MFDGKNNSGEIVLAAFDKDLELLHLIAQELSKQIWHLHVPVELCNNLDRIVDSATELANEHGFCTIAIGNAGAQDSGVAFQVMHVV